MNNSKETKLEVRAPLPNQEGKKGKEVEGGKTKENPNPWKKDYGCPYLGQGWNWRN